MRRIVSVAAALSSGLLAQAALAEGNGANDGTGGAASVAVAAAAVVTLLPPLERIAFVPQSAADPFNRLKGLVRHRFASAMVDLYPADASGFHVSFGTRFFKKQYFLRDQQEATHDLLYTPRLPRGGSGQRGFRRATPAATLGYKEAIQPNLAVGLEAGTLFGRVVEPLPSGRRLAGLPGGSRDDRSMRMNPVVNLTVAYAF